METFETQVSHWKHWKRKCHIGNIGNRSATLETKVSHWKHWKRKWHIGNIGTGSVTLDTKVSHWKHWKQKCHVGKLGNNSVTLEFQDHTGFGNGQPLPVEQRSGTGLNSEGNAVWCTKPHTIAFAVGLSLGSSTASDRSKHTLT